MCSHLTAPGLRAHVITLEATECDNQISRQLVDSLSDHANLTRFYHLAQTRYVWCRDHQSVRRLPRELCYMLWRTMSVRSDSARKNAMTVHVEQMKKCEKL